jgi:hypothetical protein
VTGIFERWAPLSFRHRTSAVARWPRRLGVLCLAQKPFHERNQNLEHGVARMAMICAGWYWIGRPLLPCNDSFVCCRAVESDVPFEQGTFTTLRF